jgi:RNA polymerase sigma-70 factor (sigma-E family)
VTFEEFAVARLPALLRFAGVVTGDRGVAEDVVQEVLIRAQLNWGRLTRMDDVEAYVRRMVVNEFVSWHRRRRRWVPVAEVVRPPSDAPDHASTHAERDELVAGLARLPRRQRAVLALRYYEGLSDAEIADVLGCRPATVRAYAARALATLRVDLRPTPALAREQT